VTIEAGGRTAARRRIFEISEQRSQSLKPERRHLFQRFYRVLDRGFSLYLDG
jgi:hypothetical protein